MARPEVPLSAQLVIPMSGVSSRFTEAGYTRPKALLDVEGQTMLDHVLDMYPGWDDVVLICNEEHLADPELGLRDKILARRPSAVIVSVAPHRAGPGWAVLQAADHIALDRPVVVNYCDFTCYWDAEDFLASLTSGDVEASMTVYTGFHPHTVSSTAYAYPKMDGLDVVDVREKQPWTSDPQGEFASSGTYGFATGRILLDALDRQVEADYHVGGEYYISLTCKAVLDAGLRVGVYEVQHFMQWGTPEDLDEYRDWSRAATSWGRPSDLSLARSSRVVLASGAGARFAQRGYVLPKPLLPVAGRSQLEHAMVSVPGDRTVVVTRADLGDDGAVASLARSAGAEVVELAGLTRGQADSARHALERLGEGSGPVTVTSCDAVPRTSSAAVRAAVGLAGPDGLVVWAARPHRLALRSPKQYGWVQPDSAGLVTDAWIKEAPEGASGVRMIVGTFTFPSQNRVRADIDALLEREITVNGEYYLDSLVPELLSQGRRVVALELDDFVSLGTPEEYESFLYWLSCFHKWPHHPYALAADPGVDARDRVDLDRQWRAFRPRVTGRTQP